MVAALWIDKTCKCYQAAYPTLHHRQHCIGDLNQRRRVGLMMSRKRRSTQRKMMLLVNQVILMMIARKSARMIFRIWFAKSASIWRVLVKSFFWNLSLVFFIHLAPLLNHSMQWCVLKSFPFFWCILHPSSGHSWLCLKEILLWRTWPLSLTLPLDL